MNAQRVGFVLCSSAASPLPSTRIAVLNMFPYLRLAGMEPMIIFEPDEANETPDLTGVAARAIQARCSTVVLQKVRGLSAVALAQQLAAIRMRTIYAVCDLVDVPMVDATDVTIAVTGYLKSLYPTHLQPRIHVVHDGIEKPEICKTSWGVGPSNVSHPLRAVLVTSASLDKLPDLNSPPAWMNIRIVGGYARGLQKWREARWTWTTKSSDGRREYLSFLLDRRISCVRWDPAGVYREMSLADIGIIPIDTAEESPDAEDPMPWQVKSENRLTMKMSMGLPVVATPIPSYEPLIEHGINGFFARSARDWQDCLSALRDHERRQEMGMAARASVIKKYSKDEQAAKLIRVLARVQ